MGGSLTSPNKIKDVYKKIVFYDDNKFKIDNGSSDVVITSAENFSSDTEQTLVNKTIDADNNTISNLEVDNLKSGVLDIDIASVAGTDTTIPSAKAVKTYVDSQVTAQDLDFQADSGGALNIDLDSETLTFTGGTGIDTSGSGNEVTFAIDSTVATKTYVKVTSLPEPDVSIPVPPVKVNVSESRSITNKYHTTNQNLKQ